MRISGITISQGITVTSPSTQPNPADFGYVSGAIDPTGPVAVAQQFSFVSDTDATVALSWNRSPAPARVSGGAGSNSGTFGYISGGQGTEVGSEIEKFPFSNATSATNVGDLATLNRFATGVSSPTNGYHVGGAPGTSKDIQKYPFSSDTNATDVGSLSHPSNGAAWAGIYSDSTAYIGGGAVPRPPSPTGAVNNIQKFSFANESTQANAGTLSRQKSYLAGGIHSATHGYFTGGEHHPSTTQRFTDIDKYPFASETGTTDVGDLATELSYHAANHSGTHGYTSGGFRLPSDPAGLVTTKIHKFPFSSEGTSSEVGDLAIQLSGNLGIGLQALG